MSPDTNTERNLNYLISPDLTKYWIGQFPFGSVTNSFFSRNGQLQEHARPLEEVEEQRNWSRRYRGLSDDPSYEVQN